MLFPQGAAEGQTVHARQHDVQNQAVKAPFQGHGQARAAVAGAVQLIAQGLQVGIEVGEDILVVLNEQQGVGHGRGRFPVGAGRGAGPRPSPGPEW